MKKFEWKSVLALALTGALALGLTACGSSDNGTAATGSNDAGSKAVYRTLDEIKKSGKLKVAVFSDKAPFGYIDKDGNVVVSFDEYEIGPGSMGIQDFVVGKSLV